MGSTPPADPGQLRAGASRFQAAARHLTETHDKLASETTRLAQSGVGWQGAGSQSFQDAWAHFGGDTRGAVDALQRTATVLNKFADAIEQAQSSQAWGIVAGIGLGLLTVVEVGVDAAQGGVDVATDAATVVTADAAASAFAAVGEGFAAAEDAAITGLDAVADSAVDVGGIAGDTTDVAADVPNDPFSGDPTTTDPTTPDGQPSEMYQPDLGADSSPLTSYGQQYIDELRNMGVEVIQDDPEQMAYMRMQNASGLTRFWGESASDTQVVLGENANDATVYEEYLHALEGQARGWTGLTPPESYIEEVNVERQVLANAEQLGMTATEQAGLQQTINSYLQILRDSFGIEAP